MPRLRSSRRRLYAKSYTPPRKRRSRRSFSRFFSDIWDIIRHRAKPDNVAASDSIATPPADGAPMNRQSNPAPVSPNTAAPNAMADERGKLIMRALNVAVLVLIAGSALFLGWAISYSDTSLDITYTSGGTTRHISTKAETVGELMRRNSLTLNEDDTLNYGMDEPLFDGMELEVTHAFPVAVASAGEVNILKMQGGSVGEALSMANITYGANDELTRLPFEDVEPGMHIQHISIDVQYETKDQVIEFKEEIIKDSTRYVGDDRIKVAGEDGEKRIVRRLIYRDGELYSREIMNQLILKEAVDQVKIVGTKIRYQTKFTGDERIWKAAPTSSEIKQTMVAVEVTAYTHTGKRTATGKWPRIGYVAVNPNIIPYGTKMYIPGYGYCTAQDTGAFRFEQEGKKNQLDVFLNTVQECKKWGRKRNVKFYILK